jgi:hypothetical protein
MGRKKKQKQGVILGKGHAPTKSWKKFWKRIECCDSTEKQAGVQVTIDGYWYSLSPSPLLFFSYMLFFFFLNHRINIIENYVKNLLF